MLNQSLDKILLKQLKINAGADITYTKRYENLLRQRKSTLNASFKLSVSALKKFEKINTILKEKEKTIISKCLEIEESILQQIKSKQSQIVDYEIDIELLYYSDKIIKHFKKFEIDYLYEDKTFGMRFIKKENRDDETCWLGIKPPEYFILNKINPCYTFYCLVEYSYLALQDIATINQIWWDITVRYQYKETINKTNENILARN